MLALFSPRRLHALLSGALVALATLSLVPQAHADAAKPASPATSAAVSSNTDAPNGVININSATAAELDRLPGVGPSRAEAIVTLRTHMKRFEHLEDIMRVKGIGRATFRKLRPMLRLDGATTLVASSSNHPAQ